jgi:hypothetical protein
MQPVSLDKPFELVSEGSIPEIKPSGEEKGRTMNSLIQLKTITPRLLFALTLICFALPPSAQAVVPPPDGCYPGFTTAEGCKALASLTTGAGNTGVGWSALFLNTTGSFNTAVGAGALDLNTGDNNTAVGAAALLLNTTGIYNTANGVDALVYNDTGSQNTANGALALFHNTIGFANTAMGPSALFFKTEGDFNTAIGNGALLQNTEGDGNTAMGGSALFGNATGDENTAIGDLALLNNSTGSNNIAVGNNAGSNVTSANNVIAIGLAGASVSNTTWIGNVYGNATLNAQAAPVVVSVDGQLATNVSSQRFKKDIIDMEKVSEAILALRPVTFHYKTDTQGIPQFGLIAEEVAKVNPALVLPDKEEKPYTVRYDQVNAMLLNEFLKEHHKVEQMQKQIDALTAVVQKVSAQLEVNKAAPQTVLNDQ